MASYYLSPVVGTGTQDDPYRPAIAAVARDWAAVIPSTPDGKPARTWALVLATVPAGTALPSGVIALGATAELDLTVSLLLSKATQSTIETTTGVSLANVSTLRELVVRVGRALIPSFDVDHLGVP